MPEATPWVMNGYTLANPGAFQCDNYSSSPEACSQLSHSSARCTRQTVEGCGARWACRRSAAARHLFSVLYPPFYTHSPLFKHLIHLLPSHILQRPTRDLSRLHDILLSDTQMHELARLFVDLGKCSKVLRGKLDELAYETASKTDESGIASIKPWRNYAHPCSVSTSLGWHSLEL